VSKLLQFVNTEQRYPDLRPAEERVKDFKEIYGNFQPARAEEQSSRCSQCGIPFCQIHCPLQNNIPDWLKLTAEERLQEAYEVSSATNNFPEICGRICPQDRLCEGNCVIEKGFHSVTIGSVEKFITENAFAQGWVKPIRVEKENGHSIGIIGAGPAGLAAAEQLRKKGYSVHIYDRYDRSGGLMMYGIPGFKLEKSVVQRRYDLMVESGIHFHFHFEVGKSATLAELQQKHAAVLIATGVYKAREIDNTPNNNLPGIIPALTYLTASNRKGLGDTVPEFDSGTLNAEGKNVVVIGGGDTAMDCVRTAVRQGAKSVICMYRRDRENMPGSAREVKNAEEEGVQFLWLSAPKAFLGTEKVEGVIGYKMRLGAPDASGRQMPIPVENSKFTLEADIVIKALGFDPEELPTLFNAPELKLTSRGTVQVDNRTLMTNLPGVFAEGDIARGASLVVWAIRDGRDAAEGIHAYVMGKQAGDATFLPNSATQNNEAKQPVVQGVNHVQHVA
jgi:glutamate synthase (NADPH/NADH) small chain